MPTLLRLSFSLDRPIECVNGSQLHGFFFSLLPVDVSRRVHAEGKKPFSLWLDALKENDLSLIVSLLDDDLLPALVHGYYLPQKDMRLKDTLLKPKKLQGLKQIKSQTYEELPQGKIYRKVYFEFLTPCTFNRYGRDYPLPDPQLVFESLLKRWNAFSERPMQEEGIREKILKEVSLTELQISTEVVEVSKGARLRGFLGKVGFLFHSEEIATLLSPLVRFAVYSGVGRKTTMGLGRVAVKFKSFS